MQNRIRYTSELEDVIQKLFWIKPSRSTGINLGYPQTVNEILNLS